MLQIFFDGWQPIIRTGVIGVLGYISIVFLLRLSGRRTLSKMNAFDFIVTIALGSTLATVLLNKDVSLAQGVLAFAALIGMQYLVTWLCARMDWVRNVVTGEPALLFYQGNYLGDAMKKARVAKNEVQSAVRAAGLESMDAVKAVVIETDGTFNVVKNDGEAKRSSLEGLLPRD